MTVQYGQGTIRSEDGCYERQCNVKIARNPVKVDEEGPPTSEVEGDPIIVDSDDGFPEGHIVYILSYNGKSYRLTKKRGRYIVA